jgi:uncharacterized protein (TIGR04255 family)
MGKNLKNQPLFDTVFELCWVPPPSLKNPFSRDPFFYVHAGKLLPLLEEQFPVIESLLPEGVPLPEEILQKMHHYRLFSENKQPPLVQFGPGILTFNTGNTYEWEIFQKKLQFVLSQLYASRPIPQKFSPKYVMLKYLNFFECSYGENQIAHYLENKLKLGVRLPENLFKSPYLSNDWLSFGFFWQFPCFDPNKNCIGIITFSINAGEKDSKPGFLMEIGAQWQSNPSLNDGIFKEKLCTFSNDVVGILEWITTVHSVIDHCFFTFVTEIENELNT